MLTYSFDVAGDLSRVRVVTRFVWQGMLVTVDWQTTVQLVAQSFEELFGGLCQAVDLQGVDYSFET